MTTNDKKNLNYIKEKIEQENINAPESLNHENVEKLLDSQFMPIKAKISCTKSKVFKAAVSIAACAAVLVMGLTVNLRYFHNSGIAKYLGINKGITEFENYEQLKDTIKDIQDKQSRYNLKDIVYETEKSASAEDDQAATSAKETGGLDHGETYTQVYGVDEADIIKNDGEYIYYACSDKIYIFETNNGNSNLAASIDFDDSAYICDMYLYKNKLIVNTLDWDEQYFGKTQILIYDITDRNNPEKINTFGQDGDYLSSRIVGNKLYVISNRNVYDESDYLPATYSEGGDAENIEIKDICCVRKPSTPSYLIATSFNLDSGDTFEDKKAVLGAGSDIYCTKDNLYVYCTDYTYGLDALTKTQILKFSLDSGRIELSSSVSIKGEIDSQYSLDEKDGYLRVAVTDTTMSGDDINTLYVFDENLDQVGKVKNFAKNEHIEAVKYIGNTAYLITYEQTDPLFIIDLSDPEDPQIKGSVKISGFSTMLHPVDENTLLGIGYATDNIFGGEVMDGLKLALFDISDSNNPKVLDSRTYRSTYSEAQDNPKALLVNNDKNYYAIPFVTYYNQDVTGVKVFEIKNNKIIETNSFDSGLETYCAERCTYIGNYIYVVLSDGDNITVRSFQN
ncbi:MAG: beta-propeller domain-containing protein [Oscillospiraceae bacterium]